MTDHSALIERLEANEPLPICPYDRRSPEYWTTNDTDPCKFCGTKNKEGAPDLCRGADTRLFAEAAAALRARSSAPEALGNLLAVIHRDGGHRTLEVGVEQAAAEAEKIVANLLSSAPEAREGEAVERRADGLAHLVAAISLLKRAEEIGKKPSMATGSKKMFDQMVKDYEGAADRMRKAIYTHPAAPSADTLRIAVEALEFYSFEDNYSGEPEDRFFVGSDDTAFTEMGLSPVQADEGKRASQALAALKGDV